MSNDYQDRLEAKRQRYLERAEKAKERGNALLSDARSMASVIPFGQPILVGHHSEKRDRNYRNRIHNKQGKGFQELEKVDYYIDKAEKLGTGGISSDDPEAIDKLNKKLADLKKVQDFMKSCNKIVKSKRKSYTFEQKIVDLVALGISEDRAKKLLTPDFCNRIGFAAYQLTNNNANIRNVEKRIKTLSLIKESSKIEKIYDDFQYIEDPEVNRVLFRFERKPTKEVTTLLKGHGFVYSHITFNKAWVRKYSNSARYIGNILVEKLQNMVVFGDK